jgi:methionine--tRNA ligase beta chain
MDIPQQTPIPAVPPVPPPAPPAPAQGPITITYDDFAKIELRVGTIRQAVAMEKSKKLLKLQVELANNELRQVLAGIKEHYTPEQLIGKQAILVANLAPRPMMGEVSHGMVLAATDSATGRVIIMTPSEPVAPGSTVK